ncbi:MAG: hypothetical protein ABSF23_00720 [Terracidiphilus sp.]|jgi:hypothetical protein
MAGAPANPPVRGTQLLVEHMSSVLRRPSLVVIEIAWRWLFGVPFLLVGWSQAKRILAAYPLEASGASSLDTQNPWIAAIQLYNVASDYEPHLLAVLRWLLPLAALGWIVLSGLGRNLLLARMNADRSPRPASRSVTMLLLQAAWLALFAGALWGWLGSMEWNAATHIAVGAEPDLVGYAIWAIFLSLGFFTAFALVSWIASIAPILALLEGRSAFSALAQSLRLGKAFTGKLVEINLVLGIVKLALVVVAMVFSAAPLPFSDELGPGAMHVVAAASVVFFFVADDFFQVVRIRAFVEFWTVYRGS